MDRYPNPTRRAVDVTADAADYVQAKLSNESIASAIERFAKMDDYLGHLLGRAVSLRDDLAPLPPPPPQSVSTSAPRAPGKVASVNDLADSISDRLAALDRVLADIQQAIG